MRAWSICVLIVTATGAAGAASDPAREQALATTLARVGAYVQQYYGRAQRVVAEEDVTLQPLDVNLSFDGFPRRVRNELRIDWDPTAADAEDRARVVRTTIKTGGPALFDPGEDDCADPQTLTPEPLSFLLPESQPDWLFTPAKPARIDSRQTVTFEYVQRHPHRVEVTGTNNCVFVDLSGHTKGRVWADPDTGEVLRVDEWLEGPVDIRVPRQFQKKVASRIQYERQTSSVRYKPVRFTDPDETLLLPSSIDAMSVYRGRSVTRLRTTQEFSNYRRFVTETRVLGE
ncbi:MAG TPA: hypothetical protein VG871_07190, partial [Vicinamibacterales bacterium]|nr:hypothetical protein [Vicinamibacterales bacterium]